MAIGRSRRQSFWILLLLLHVTSLVADSSVEAGTVSKAYPGTPEWPSLNDWAALNTTLAGRLIKSSDPASVCHYGSTYDPKICALFQKNIQNATWIGGHPTLPNWPQFLGAECAGNDTNCDVVKFPAYIVKATKAEDVQRAVRWAAEKNVRVVIKNTGHDFLGRNIGFGALSIWTRHIRGIEWLDKWNGTTSRVDISGQWKGKAIRYGSGHVWGDISDAVGKRNHFVVTGAESTVGAGGGWLLGGGHGPYSNKYGLGVEQVLEFEIVTPTGDILTTNEQSYPDLFWALSGGGASTYGIITRVTYKTYENPQQSILLIKIKPKSKSPADQEAYYRAMAYFMTVHVNMTDFGITGYPMLSKSNYAGIFVAPGISYAQMTNFLQPITKRLAKEGVSVQYIPMGRRLVDALTWMGSNIQGPSVVQDTASKLAEPCGFPFAMGSRLISRKGLAEDNIPAITRMLKTILEEDNAFLLPYPNMPGKQHHNRAWNFGLNPAWKTSALHLIAVWNEGVGGRAIGDTGLFRTVEESKAKVQQMEKVVAEKWTPVLDALSENHGAYINEGSPYEKDWKTTFYGGGENYEKLLAVKRKYDPKNTLWCFPCVGGDVFREGEDGKLYHPS